MKKILFLLLTLSPLWTSAQDVNSEVNVEQLLPLDSLITLALEQAPLIKRLSMGQAQREEEIKIARKSWMQHLALTGGYNYGNVVLADQTATPQDVNTIFRTNTSATFTVGVSLRLPLSEFTTQKNRVSIQEFAIKEMEYQKEDLEFTITQEVITRYNDLHRGLTTIKYQTQKVEANEAAVQVTENHFKTGTASIDQYRMALDILTTSKIELEKTKSDVWYALKSLEQIVGSPILK
ncbi:TolC family protein [Algoriphagus litoralis]|uniref:TolC family protein n=1 Tax=Algoriphagus litoralis TaxID=2202829 RepID=UPI000DBAA3DB|nr:TolC family protein [Algoriphagus litoralis]